MQITRRDIQGPSFFSEKSLRRIFIVGLTLISLTLVVFGVRFLKKDALSDEFTTALFNKEELDFLESPSSVFDNFFATNLRHYDEIRSGENLFTALLRLKLSPSVAEKFSTAVGKAINTRFLAPGDALMVERESPNIQIGIINNFSSSAHYLEPLAVELFTKNESGVAYRVRVELKGTDIRNAEVKVTNPKVYRDHTLINGAINNSIYAAIVNSGGDAQLVNNFADIFAWQFDFYKDTRDGDTYQMIVERNISEGRFVNYGKVLAAEYVNNGKPIRGFYFESNDKQIAGFFDNKGQSLKNAFLKAPLKIAAISSKFGMRYHPVHGRLKPHNGVDYGAVRGTPFMAVASGTVVNAGYTPFNGNWVRIRHLNGYETEYLHATHLAKGVRTGAQIKQGQVIGYVGKTGLATGYHLHFGMKQNGKYVNPSAQKFARGMGVPPKYMAEFSRSIEAMVIALNRKTPDRQVALLP